MKKREEGGAGEKRRSCKSFDENSIQHERGRGKRKEREKKLMRENEQANEVNQCNSPNSMCSRSSKRRCERW